MARGTVLGHVARGNLQWRDTVPGTEGLAIFVGPQAYISPR
ncbi:MAG: FMN-binding negative transcriptional regulator [Nitrososphaerota archaeon]|nr:FMN-binding negative transcriptional regulator [Nitrososphaerota archaeon]MDG7014349.1 FMN-binding negative transcriptional regulator [Nitrososphaerota archaeon]MDG7026593.1 FMN-binding negative transcriptional regulator [Nitrososphaerota archaeon]